MLYGTEEFVDTSVSPGKAHMLNRIKLLQGQHGLWILLLLFATPDFGLAQGSISASGRAVEYKARPRVFVDCSGPITCQPELHRTEIPWVDWVNNREDADVHVISTRQDLAGGTIRMTARFEGLGDRSHLSDVLAFTSPGTDLMRARQDGFIRVLKLGLMRFAVEGGLGSDFDLAYSPAQVVGSDLATGASEVSQGYDPWNYWTFRAGATGNFSEQATRSSHRLNLSFNADRVTEAWKFTLSTNGSLSRELITLSGGREVRNDRDNWSVGTMVARSLGQHVSAGFDATAGKLDTNNRKGQFSLNPAIEWNYFPYDQTGRRQLIAHYGAGYKHNTYEEETVFGVTRETIPFHRIGIQYAVVETWGTASVSASASQFLHQEDLYSYGLQGNLTFRIVRGLDLTVSANANRVADQIHIPASDLSDEDILLGRQSLPTSYSYQGSLGLSYRWGSIFSNIVNTRFPQNVR